MARNGEPKVLSGATTNPYGRADEELASVVARDERKKKRTKYLVYIAAFAVFQTAIILIFALTVMKVKTPKFRVRSATFENFQVSTLNTNASFNIRMNAELGVKNTNFGHYKYQNSTIEFFYKDFKVGEANILRARAKARKTRKFNVAIDLSSANVPISQELGNEFSQHAWIPLTSRSTLRGKVEIMKVMKKKKSSNMNCTMSLNISSKQLQDLKCR